MKRKDGASSSIGNSPVFLNSWQHQQASPAPHFFQSPIMCPMQTMLHFHIGKIPFHRLFSDGIEFPVFWNIPQMLCFFIVVLPYVASDYFRVVLALRALMKIRTASAHRRVRFVFPVPFPIRSRVR